MNELPASVYLVIGIMVVSNLTSIGFLITFIFKCGVFVADTKSGIIEAKETAVRAHKRIDLIDQQKGV